MRKSNMYPNLDLERIEGKTAFSWLAIYRLATVIKDLRPRSTIYVQIEISFQAPISWFVDKIISGLAITILDLSRR